MAIVEDFFPTKEAGQGEAAVAVLFPASAGSVLSSPEWAPEAFFLFYLMYFSGSSTRDSLYQPRLTMCLLIAAACRPLPVTFHRGESPGTGPSFWSADGTWGWEVAGLNGCWSSFGGGGKLCVLCKSTLWLCPLPRR